MCGTLTLPAWGCSTKPPPDSTSCQPWGCAASSGNASSTAADKGRQRGPKVSGCWCSVWAKPQWVRVPHDLLKQQEFEIPHCSLAHQTIIKARISIDSHILPVDCPAPPKQQQQPLGGHLTSITSLLDCQIKSLWLLFLPLHSLSYLSNEFSGTDLGIPRVYF